MAKYFSAGRCYMVGVIGFWNIQLALPALILFWLVIGISNLISPAEKRFLPRFYWADYALTLLFTLEIINYIFSIYRPNSLFQFEKILYFILLFYTLRLTFQNNTSRDLIFTILGGYGALLSMGAFFIFLLLQVQLKITGWSDASQFKGLFSPYQLLNNEWATLAIAFMAFPLVMGAIFKQSKLIIGVGLLGFAFANVGVFISFSRGAYISLAFFWILAIMLILYFRNLSLKSLLIPIIISGGLILAFMMPSMQPLMTTVAMNKTVSQQRSTQGRMDIIKRGLCQAKDHLWLGAGGNNYPLINDKCKIAEEYQGYSGFTNNTYLQILLEKGIIGLAGYALFFLSLIAAFWQQIIGQTEQYRRLLAILLFTGLLTFAFRELFFSTLFYGSGAITMLAILAAAAFRHTDQGNKIFTNKFYLLLWIVIILAFGFVFYKKNQFQRAANQANRCIEAIENGDQNAAQTAIDQAIKIHPDIAPYYALRSLMILQNNDATDVNKNRAKEDLKKALQLNPYDSGYLFNLGWLENSKDYIEQALTLDPNHVELLIWDGFIQENQGDTLGAFAQYERAFRLYPELLDTPFYTYLLQNNKEKVNNLINKIEYDLQHEIDTAYSTVQAARLARILLAKDSTDAAKKLLDRIIIELPALNRPYYHLAMIARKEGDENKAIDLLEQSFFLDRNDLLVNLEFGNIFYQRQSENRGENTLAIYHHKNVLRQWLSARTAPFVKSSVKYQGYVGLRNDLINTTILPLCQPNIDVKKVLLQLAELYERIEEPELAKHYYTLAQKNINKIKATDIKD
ncbi:MAG: O-antigen ligase family protein [Saprospiraceae bacterium]|nr:O-antigen ligase family protein [Saprospiraceae bacterium]